MNHTQGNVIPIPGADRPTRTYLEVVADFDNGRAIIRPGKSGRRLPQFWDVWVRNNVLKLTPENASVEIWTAGRFVYVKSPQGYPVALHLATAAASKVYAFPELPLIRARRYVGERYAFFWRLRDPQVRLTRDSEGRPNRIRYRADMARLADMLEEVARSIPLPEGCQVHVIHPHLDSPEDAATYVKLEIARSVTQRPADLRKQVELRFALALMPLHRPTR